MAIRTKTGKIGGKRGRASLWAFLLLILGAKLAAEETEFSFVLPFKPDEVLFDPDYKILRWTDEFKF